MTEGQLKNMLAGRFYAAIYSALLRSRATKKEITWAIAYVLDKGLFFAVDAKSALPETWKVIWGNASLSRFANLAQSSQGQLIGIISFVQACKSEFGIQEPYSIAKALSERFPELTGHSSPFGRNA